MGSTVGPSPTVRYASAVTHAHFVDEVALEPIAPVTTSPGSRPS